MFWRAFRGPPDPCIPPGLTIIFNPARRQYEQATGWNLSALVLAQATQRTYRLVVKGRAQTTPAIVVKGKTYVPLEALQKAGEVVPPRLYAFRPIIPYFPQPQRLLWLRRPLWQPPPGPQHPR